MISRSNSARQTPHHWKTSICLVFLVWAAQTWEGHKTQAQPSLCLWELPECLNLSGLDLVGASSPELASDGSRQSNLEPEQCGQGGYMRREQGQAQCGWGTASTRQSYLFAASLPPHSTTEQVSLKKKKKKGVHHPLCIRAEIRHWRDQQTEEVITEGIALEATGNRLKPMVSTDYIGKGL